jgi:hypothetical protein
MVGIIIPMRSGSMELTPGLETKDIIVPPPGKQLPPMENAEVCFGFLAIWSMMF